MSIQFQKERITSNQKALKLSRISKQVYSENYSDYLNKAGWRLERKIPSNKYYYSDLLEDTDWESSIQILYPQSITE